MRGQQAAVFLAAGLLALASAGKACSGEVFATGSAWRFFRGQTGAPGSTASGWLEPDFNDSGWETGTAPLFYGLPLAGTALLDMPGNFTCVYLRRAFVLEKPEEVKKLVLGVISDDGFVAWLDGREVARWNVPGDFPPFDAVASVAQTGPAPFATYDIEGVQGQLAAGMHVLAVQALNVTRLADPDFLFDASLAAVVDDAPPQVEFVIPPAGAALRQLASIEVQFDEPVLGVEASDLLLNGVPATNVIQMTPADFLFTFEPPADGLLTVTWRLDHGITDWVGPVHPLAGSAWTYFIDRLSPPPGLAITEFMADNKKTLNDEEGDSPDWVEVANAETEPANLDGWFLTDSAGNLAKWRFPDVTVPARGYLIVFASGKDRTNATGRLHTNFKLSSENGFLALVSPATNIVSSFAPFYPKQLTDVSYGRVPGDAGLPGYFTTPTPGAANSSSGPGFAPAVAFSQLSGTFTAPFALTLRADSPSAVIRYTLNGAAVTNTSPVYTNPIPVTTSVQVRARTYQAGLLPGPPHSESYILLHSALLSFTSNIPVLVLHDLGQGTPTSSKLVFAHLSVYEPVNGRTALTNAPTFATRAGIQLRGSSTEGYAKSSYKLEFWDEFNTDRKAPFLGMPPESDWVLYAPNNFDPVLIHNPFVHQLSRDLGRYSPRTRFVEVYLNRSTGAVTSANYSGIYVVEEKIKVGPDRVDIDELQPENTLAPAVTGGYLMKIDRLDPGDAGIPAGGVTLGLLDPKERELRTAQRAPQKTYLVNYFNAFQRALSGPSWLDPVTGYRPYVDRAAWIDFHTLEVLSGNVDALVLSTYFHKPRNAPIVFGPHWDFDRALGSTDGRDANPRIWTTGPFFSATWWSRLFTDKDFWQAWVDRWQALRQREFALTNLHGLVDRLANEVRQAQPREYAKWRVAMRGGSYQSEINLMKNWLSNRVDFIDRQLTQPPTLSAPPGNVPAGFLVTLAGPAGATNYFTLDGSDPRAPQGDIAAGARPYTGPLRIDANARLVVRARDPNKRQSGGPPSSTPWSMPVAATYVVTPPPLLVTEIMYHPAPPPAGSTNSTSDFEFIELKNVGTSVLSLAGFRLTNGVAFTFTATSAVTALAPGARVLVVKNRTAFMSRYPGLWPVAGEFIGSLDNAGERLTLLGPLQEPVSDFVFDAQREPLAGGLGFSLVLADETTPPAQLDQAGAWRHSARSGGSPGSLDPPTPALPRVRVNEVQSHASAAGADAVELLNLERTPADVSGWYLTDDFREPRKYRIPDQTVVPARGVLLFTEAEFGAGPTGFAFSAFGDEAHLFSADAAGTLTGYWHGVAFGAAARDATFGLHWTSDRHEHFVEQVRPSLGTLNDGPRLGPVVITEIMYEPPRAGDLNNTLDEYLELYNLTVAPVPLFDPGHPTNTWRLRGGAELDFPANLILGPHQHLLLVSFNPTDDLGNLAAFRQRYQVSLTVPIVGPWRGHLNNAGDAVRLLRPEEPVAAPSPHAGEVPYVLVEAVTYGKEEPWPTNTAGTGLSLSRRWPAVFANEPTAWIASAPGPGITDSDGDGLPDAWEREYGLDPFWAGGDDGAEGNPTGDGVSNWQKYLANLPPWDGPTTLHCRLLPGPEPAVELSFVSLPGHGSALLRCDGFGPGAWQVLREFPPVAVPVTNVVQEPLTAGNRFYRLRLQ